MRRDGATLRHPPQLAQVVRVGRRGPLLRTRLKLPLTVLGALLAVTVPVGSAHAVSPVPVVSLHLYLPVRLEPRAPLATPQLTLNVNLTISEGTVIHQLSRQFWGVNIEPYATLKTNITKFLSNTPVRFARWPGGSVGDDFNYTSNQLHWPSGGGYTPPLTTADFITWCRSVNCVADFELPGEINSSATAAYYVKYVEQTLGFHPAYWEIGNEPALWSHYNEPWSQWGHPGNRSKITPTGYALLVQRYVAAIRAVDPHARIMGLPGVGTGAYRESLWIYDSVLVNGPNLSGVSIHVYPAGYTMDRNGTLPHFYATLNRTGTLSHRVPGDLRAIRSACPNCTGLKLFVTEAGSGSDLGGAIRGTIATAMSTFPQVPFIAALATQAMNAKVRSVDFFCLESQYPGALFNGSAGAFRPVATLFDTFLPRLQTTVVSTTFSGAPAGLFLAATRNANSTVVSLLIANTNTTAFAQFPMSAIGALALGFGHQWTWDRAQKTPTERSWALLTPSSFLVPPESVVLVEDATLASLL